MHRIVKNKIRENKDEIAGDIIVDTPLLVLNEAEIIYFEQTRKECDTEKTEKDKVLNYAILVSGGASVFGIYKIDFVSINQSIITILISTILLFTMVTLFGWRRQKIQAQALRWAVLKEIIDKRKTDTDWITVEDIIIDGLKVNKHGIHDKWFFVELSLPFLTFTFWHSYLIFQNTKLYWVAIAILINLFSFFKCLYSLGKPLKFNFKK